ncbi:MAG: potassium transporter TrkG [Evtepia sp.]
MKKVRAMPFLRNVNPTRIVALSFGILIISGALLLLLPCMSNDGRSAGPLTALFTATSATCVTGLSLVDTLTQWSIPGQIVILLMIQLGGLGFMTAYTLILLALQRKIGLSQRMIIASTLNLNHMSGVVRVVKNALYGTLLIEGIGAALLSIRFIPQFGILGGIWRSIFHAISAFCNAGFDLLGVNGAMFSMIHYNNDPLVMLVHMGLIVVGGLGFFVWADVRHYFRSGKLSLYTKMVLTITAILIVFGFVFFFFAEGDNPNTFGQMSFGQKALNALFQSVTLRTAGFAAVSQDGLRDGSMVVSAVLMLIGGSSGSAAGGIKTVTMGILILTLMAGLRGKEEVTIAGRSIPHSRVMNAMTLSATMLILFFVCSIVISLGENIPYLPAAFEVASALGTVGLSANLTPLLSMPSQLLLVGLMYLGRVGILSFSIAFLAKKRMEPKVSYPAFDVMIG